MSSKQNDGTLIGRAMMIIIQQFHLDHITIMGQDRQD